MAAVTRVKLGKLGAGTTDYGLQIYDASGVLMHDLTGLATAGIVASAITAAAAYSNDADSTVFGDSGEVELGTITVTTNGGFVAVWGKVSQKSYTSSGSVYVTYRIRKDSTSGTVLAITKTKGNLPLIILAIDSSPSSSQVYKLTCDVEGTDHADSVIANYRRMLGSNYKR